MLTHLITKLQTHEAKPTELQGKIYKSTIKVRDFNIFLSLINRTDRQKSSKDVEDLNTMNQLDLIDIYQTHHPTAIEYTFFSSIHKSFTKISHILTKKTSLNKLKRIKMIQSMTTRK